jgi:hypothetical protein
MEAFLHARKPKRDFICFHGSIAKCRKFVLLKEKKNSFTGKIWYRCKEDTYARVALTVQLLVSLMDVFAQKMLGNVSRQYVEQ